MNIFILLSLFSSVTLFFLGIWVYFLAEKKQLNRVFLLLCLSLSYWAFTEFMLRQAETPDTAYLWMKVSTLWPFALAFFVHFALVFSEERKLLANKLTYVLIYGPAIVFFIVDSFTNSINAGVEKLFWGYSYVPQLDSWIFLVSQIWGLAMGFLALFICARYGFKSADRKKRQQSKYVSIGFSFTLLAGLIEVAAHVFLTFEIPEMTATSAAGLGVFLGYAIWKYELFSLNPVTAVENIISIMPDFLILADIEGKILTVNQSVVNLLGYKESELIGKSANILFAEEHFGDEIQEKMLTVGVLKDYETEWKTKTGERLNVSFSGSFVKSKEGQRVGIVGVAHDITDRKKSEESLNRAMDELVSVNEKLGVVGNLTRHDVRNKLSSITGNIYLLKKKHSDNPEIINRLGQMEDACRSIVEIFDFAKMYEQIGVGKLSLTDVGKAIDEAKAFFSSSSNVKIINACQGLTVNADSMLRQLFYNLIDNSLKHGKTVTEIKLWFNSETSVIKLFYEDNGVGIIEANKGLIFSEGFTTGGTGIGLKLIKKMIESYGWIIEENGIPSKGARFQITIPKSALFY